MTARAAVEVADGVLVLTSRRDTTTSTVVHLGGGAALLVDPAWDIDELVGLADLLEHRGWHAVAGIATHAHHDHLLWHPRLGDGPRWASARTVALAAEHRDDLVAALGPGWPSELAALVGAVQVAPQPLPLGEPVELLVHDGHAPGHTAVWLPERGVLLAGDLLSDVELPLPLLPDGLPAYVAALDLLAPVVTRAAVLVLGHGRPTTDPQARLAADLAYLAALAAGVEALDPRRDNPGMAEVHDRVSALARPAAD